MTKVGVPFILISSVARLPMADDRVGLLLILEARHRLIVGEAGWTHGGDQRLERLVDERPLVLLGEQKLDRGERLVVADAARQHESRDVERVAREFAKDVPDLAGVDVVLLQLGKDLAAEGRAMGAGQRAIFDDRHARRVAHRQFRQRAGLENRGHVDRSIGLGRRRSGESAIRGERRGGKDGGEGKPAKRGEGQSQAPEDGKTVGTADKCAQSPASGKSALPRRSNRMRGFGRDRSQARYRPRPAILARRGWHVSPSRDSSGVERGAARWNTGSLAIRASRSRC